MNKNELDDFLIRGWSDGGSIFYNGKIYLFDCYVTEKAPIDHCLSIVNFDAKNNDDGTFSAYGDGGVYRGYNVLIDEKFPTMAEAKQRCFSAKVFEGKSFWEVCEALLWLDDTGFILDI